MLLKRFYVLSLACLSTLAGCAPATSDMTLPVVSHQLASPYKEPARAYLAEAKQQAGDERQASQLKAAGRLIYDGQWQQGEQILSQLRALSPDLQNEKNLLQAKVSLTRERPQQAITYLAKIPDATGLSPYSQAQYHDMLAQAYQSVGRHSASLTERIKLSHTLPDAQSKMNNMRALWLTLTNLPDAELHTMGLESSDGTERQGWLKLAEVSRQHFQDPQGVRTALDDWGAHYPTHPANQLIKTGNTSKMVAPPERIALLLPLSGPLAGPGNAVRDGFLAAKAESRTPRNVSVIFYDTHQRDIATLYQQALTEGAEYVVGPLTKADVAKIDKLPHPVPTLFLNDLNTRTRDNSFQFGLSPSLEARQVAGKARKSGHTRALIIAPQGAWGDEVLAGFQDQFGKSGGRVVDTLRYGAHQDLNTAVRHFLRITASEDRQKQLRQLLGNQLESTPSRRQDFDMVFLLAYPSKGRQIVPLLNYYYAGDIPVYATSSIYSGSPNAMKDRDLNGVIFCDMPWVFNHTAGNKNWPEQLNSYNRLYAIGMDSYRLASQLNQLLVFPAMGVSDSSGTLYLNNTNQIGRILGWGQFKQGVASPVGAATT